MGEIIYLKDRLEGINMGEVTIFDIAKAFLCIKSMTHKKLQKLCYYAQAWYLVLFGLPLFKQHFEAWIHGPVCPSLYNEYRDFGWQPIPKEEILPDVIMGDEEKIEFLKQVYRIYGELDGDQLEDLTHSERPWQEARQKQNCKPWEPCREPITDEVMRSFYLEEFERSQND